MYRNFSQSLLVPAKLVQCSTSIRSTKTTNHCYAFSYSTIRDLATKHIQCITSIRPTKMAPFPVVDTNCCYATLRYLTTKHPNRIPPAYRPETKPDESDMYWKNTSSPKRPLRLKNLSSAPTPALILGFSGLIPFLVPPLYLMDQGLILPEVLDLQIKYGAAILAFLGGSRWGLTVACTNQEAPPNWSNLTYSVILPLVAWGSLYLPDIVTQLTVLSGSLIMACIVDVRTPGYPLWFKTLRTYLTIFAYISVMLSLLLTYAYPRADEVESDSVTL